MYALRLSTAVIFVAELGDKSELTDHDVRRPGYRAARGAHRDRLQHTAIVQLACDLPNNPLITGERADDELATSPCHAGRLGGAKPAHWDEWSYSGRGRVFALFSGFATTRCTPSQA